MATFAPASCLRSDWIEFGQPNGWPAARSAEGESHGWDEHIPLHATTAFNEANRPLAEIPKPDRVTKGTAIADGSGDMLAPYLSENGQ